MTTTQTTTVTLIVSPVAPIVGGIITFLAKITPSDSGTPTGTVTFASPGIIHGTVPIVYNEARFTIDTSFTVSPSTSYTATYNGDTTYASSTSSTSTVSFTAYTAANGVWNANTSTSGAFDYTQQLNYIASSLRTIAVNSSEIRNFIGDIDRSISTVANLASGNGVHTSGAYDWLGAASLYNYFVEQGVAANTSGNANSSVQLAANTALAQYANSSAPNSVFTLKNF